MQPSETHSTEQPNIRIRLDLSKNIIWRMFRNPILPKAHRENPQRTEMVNFLVCNGIRWT